MGAELSNFLRESPRISKEAVIFCECFEPYCHKTDRSTAMRAEAFKILDGNSNGHASLAETSKWIKDELMRHDRARGEDIYRYFYPCYIRAHLNAAKAGFEAPVRGAKAMESDYVQKREFRLFCAYLCFYGLMLDAFHLLDGFTMSLLRVDGHYRTAEGEDNDRRVSRDEWRAHCGSFAGSPFVGLREVARDDPEDSFRRVDGNGKGMILFSEFCEFVKSQEIRRGTEMGALLDFQAERDFVPSKK